jgi:RNA polymerase sigma-70 factor (ECF subfamily)
MEEANERALIDRIVVADLAAFDLLYRAYHPRLTRFIGRMTHRPALVGEALNDTMLVVWQKAGTFNGSSKVSTWVFGIAYRIALKALSRLDEPMADVPEDVATAAEHDPAAGRGTPDDSGDSAGNAPNPEHAASAAQRRRGLERALLQLTPEHRAVVDLTYFHGLSYAEIAEVESCPVDTVKTRMFYARRRLKALLPGAKEDWL